MGGKIYGVAENGLYHYKSSFISLKKDSSLISILYLDLSSIFFSISNDDACLMTMSMKEFCNGIHIWLTFILHRPKQIW